MPKLKDWLQPLLVISSNGFFCWLINQLPGKQDLQIHNSVIFWLIGGCTVALFILELSSKSQSYPAPGKQNWLVGFLPLIGGGILYSLIRFQQVPAEFTSVVFYSSLGLFVVGIVLPPVLLLPRIWQRRLIWVPSGVGLGIAVHFLQQGQWIAAVSFLVLTIFILFLPIIFRLLNKLRQQSKLRLGPLVEQGIDAIATGIINFLSSLITWNFKHKYYRSLVYICRDYQTQGLDKDRILALQKVFVPLKIAFNKAFPTGLMIENKRGKLENSKEKQIWDFLAAMVQNPGFRRIAVLGAPGSGKTTLLRYLTLTYASKQERKLHPQAPKLIPVLLYLKDVRQVIVEKKLPLAELITQQVKPLNPPPNWFANKLRRSKCLVMLDGLDEVADETQRQQVSSWVDEQMETYPDTPFILTSRPFGYQSARLQQGLTVLEVQSFNWKQVQQFIHSWYFQTEVMSRAGVKDLGVQQEAQQQADDLIKRIRSSSPLVAMAVNPLLLTMIATVHRRGSALPGKRVELYKEICQVLLERRQRAKKIDEPLTATQKQSVLQVLALALMEKETREFTMPEGVSLMQNQLAEVAGSAANSQKFLEQIKDFSGLLVEKEVGVYEFAHLSFQEYLAAVEIKETKQEELLIGNINHSWWTETIRLYAAQTNASNLILAVLVLPSPSVETMALAYDCLEEGLSVYPEVQQQLETRLEADLGELMTERFQLAANLLLSRRLRNLVPIDEHVEIDLNYITCAEYQFFMNEKCQPDHWKNYRFPPGDAQKPITGVRASDAEKFCQWLTQLHSNLGFRYRLPTLTEVEKYPVTEQKIGCWCKDNRGEKVIAGIDAAQWQDWHSNLAEVIILNYNLNRDFNRKLNYLLNRFLNRDLYHELNRDLNPDINGDIYGDLERFQDRDFDGILYHNFDRVLYRLLDRFLYRILDRVLYRDLNRVLNRDIYRILDRILYRDLNRDLYNELNHFLNHDLKGDFNDELYRDLKDRIEADEVSDFLILYFPLLFLIVIYQVLSVTYKALSQNKEALKQINLSRQESEAISHKYQEKIDDIYPLYVYLVLLDERQAGRIPAWEGIRLVRERVD